MAGCNCGCGAEYGTCLREKLRSWRDNGIASTLVPQHFKQAQTQREMHREVIEGARIHGHQIERAR